MRKTKVNQKTKIYDWIPKKRNEQAITLITLIVSVIVVLILTGVTLSTLNIDNGILTKLTKTKEIVEQSQEKENAILEELDSYMKEGEKTVYNKVDGVNCPQLTEGMIPVKYDTGKQKWVITNEKDADWYNYKNEKRWANVMLSDGKYKASIPSEYTTDGQTVIEADELGSMFVWIPRYCYKIISGYHGTVGEIQVKFLMGTTNQTTDNALVTEYNAQTTENYSKFPNDYVVHPAFRDGTSNGFQNGEWNKELAGIWVAKFQAGFATTSNDISQKEDTTGYYYPIFKGRKFAYNYVTISQCYNLSLALDNTGNPYGLSTSANSHLMKNSEWGAVAYLSISQYGYSNGSSNNEKYKNNLSLVSRDASSSPVIVPNRNSGKITAITGYSAMAVRAEQNNMTNYTNPSSLTDEVSGSNGVSYAWDNTNLNQYEGNGTKASTTGNIYGIYDIDGCLANYTASYIEKGELALGNAFATGISTNLATAYPSAACISGIYDVNNAYPGFGPIFGDAIWEMSSGVAPQRTWFDKIIESDSHRSEPFFIRGGEWDCFGDTNSFCGLYDGQGGYSQFYGFHTVLVVE